MFLEMSEFYFTIYVQMLCCLHFKEGFMSIQRIDISLLVEYDNRGVVLATLETFQHPCVLAGPMKSPTICHAIHPNIH